MHGKVTAALVDRLPQQRATQARARSCPRMPTSLQTLSWRTSSMASASACRPRCATRSAAVLSPTLAYFPAKLTHACPSKRRASSAVFLTSSVFYKSMRWHVEACTLRMARQHRIHTCALIDTIFHFQSVCFESTYTQKVIFMSKRCCV